MIHHEVLTWKKLEGGRKKEEAPGDVVMFIHHNRPPLQSTP